MSTLKYKKTTNVMKIMIMRLQNWKTNHYVNNLSHKIIITFSTVQKLFCLYFWPLDLVILYEGPSYLSSQLLQVLPDWKKWKDYSGDAERFISLWCQEYNLKIPWSLWPDKAYTGLIKLLLLRPAYHKWWKHSDIFDM